MSTSMVLRARKVYTLTVLSWPKRLARPMDWVIAWLCSSKVLANMEEMKMTWLALTRFLETIVSEQSLRQN